MLKTLRTKFIILHHEGILTDDEYEYLMDLLEAKENGGIVWKKGLKMTIKEAIERARKMGLTRGSHIESAGFEEKASYDAILTIEGALENGYTLCKVDEAIKKIEELFNSTDNRDFRLAFHHAIKIIKEACEC